MQIKNRICCPYSYESFRISSVLKQPPYPKARRVIAVVSYCRVVSDSRNEKNALVVRDVASCWAIVITHVVAIPEFDYLVY
jgi:hypothetical protein